MAKHNNKGFSMIELIVVVAILIVAVGVTATSLRTMYNARSLKAAKTIDGMISQSKINAMSGKKNTFVLRYSEDDGCYFCELVDAAGNAYESEQVGNNSLEVTIDSANNVKENNLEIRFNGDTGAIKTLKYGGADHSTGWSSKVINLESLTVHSITLYRTTGEHNFV